MHCPPLALYGAASRHECGASPGPSRAGVSGMLLRSHTVTLCRRHAGIWRLRPRWWPAVLKRRARRARALVWTRSRRCESRPLMCAAAGAGVHRRRVSFRFISAVDASGASLAATPGDQARPCLPERSPPWQADVLGAICAASGSRPHAHRFLAHMPRSSASRSEALLLEHEPGLPETVGGG